MQKLQHQLLARMPKMQWSLLKAYKKGQGAPPPFVPPTFEEEVFEPHLKLERRTIAGFDSVGHVEKMKAVDAANEFFRFAYTRGHDEETDEEKGYYKIPLMRNRNVDVNDIKKKCRYAEYVLATAIFEAVGEMERIVRAIPYYGLYKSVTDHLNTVYGVDSNESSTVLISIDRGGRIPCLILGRALNHQRIETLKVDQGTERLDEDKLHEFAERMCLRNKHVLFVDSTVDSGRQIRALQRHFDSSELMDLLQYKSWSIVGSNENGDSLDNHLNVNWGVDPDTTFEDNPQLMGIDYAVDNNTKVVERPTAASETIRKALMSVPDGVIYDADDIVEQVNSQYQEWQKCQSGRRATHTASVDAAKTVHNEEVTAWQLEQAEQKLQNEVEHEWNRITTSKMWRNAIAKDATVSFDNLPATIPNGVPHTLHNILVVGNGKRTDLPTEVTNLIADTLGPYHSFSAGTPDGNPGAVLRTVLSRAPNAKVRLYQPSSQMGKTHGSLVGTYIVNYRGPKKSDMRRDMIDDSHIALVLGGAGGTLREVLLALKLGKPAIVIKGWGAIADCLLASKKWKSLPNLKAVNGVAEAMQTIMDMTKS